MKRNTFPATAFTAFALVAALAAAWPTQAQEAKSQYPSSMAPVDQYLMERSAEIALARSAAPDSISKDAEIMVLGPKGYETAVKGQNGFVCLVHRSWTDKLDDREFWNPTRRGPMCLNAAAARSYLPNTVMRTNLALAGRSKEQIFEAINAAYDKKELPAVESGAMCYMLARQSHLSDRDGHWHPHLMFFFPPKQDPAWGANLPDSPILADDDVADRMKVVLIPVAKWSDGTSDSGDAR
jgi:hypothetical protein